MKTIALDINNDWTCFEVKKDIYAVEQLLNTRLRMIKNDCFFDLDAGFDYENFNYNKLDKIIAEIKNIILNTEGVTKILTFDYNLDNIIRKLTIKYFVETLYRQNINNTLIL